MSLCKDENQHNAMARLVIERIQDRSAPSSVRNLLALVACLASVTACAMSGSGTASSGPEAYASLVAEGRTFASLKCANCHALDRGEFSANWNAPPMKRLLPHLEFKILERDRGQDTAMTHGDMPPLHLSMVDKEALVAYLQSIADPPVN
jgi:mono/diheme cytochrome c family protein